MTDYISREVVLNLIKELYAEAESPEAAEALFETHERIAEHPAADVKPVVRGEWQQVEVHENKRRWADQNVSAIASMYCPKCKRYHNEVYFHGDPVENVNFCPNCGADMRKEAQA